MKKAVAILQPLIEADNRKVSAVQESIDGYRKRGCA